MNKIVKDNEWYGADDFVLILKKNNRQTKRYRRIAYFVPNGKGGYSTTKG